MRPFRQADIGLNANGIPLGVMSSSTEDLVPKHTTLSTKNASANPDNPRDDLSSDQDSIAELDELDDLDPLPSASQPLHHSNSPNPNALSPHQTQQKLLLQCLLLEAGILFHSIFIGIALSVSLPPAFYILLLAISFHQTFEGLALGSRIAAATSALPSSSIQPWLMALAYGATTPIGQAIGLAVHGLYDPEGEAGLLMVGVMNAVSSGLLLFAGLVELLAEDFLSDRSYEILRGKRRLEACAAVVAGGALMALVGAWA